MTTVKERGFTIIEAMLFLAISGALFAALMVGVGSNVTRQRYTDSVRSFVSLLEGQYAAAMNIENQNSRNFACSMGAGVISGTRTWRGNSKCVVLGRAIRIDTYGNKIEVSSVTGEDFSGDLQNLSEEVAISKFNPKISDFDKNDVTVEWSSNLKKNITSGSPAPSPLNTNNNLVTIVILRSPLSGAMSVYAKEDYPKNIVDIASAATPLISATAVSLSYCMDGDTGPQPKQIITIDTSPSAINFISTKDANGSECL